MDRRAFLSNCAVAGAAASVFTPVTEASPTVVAAGSAPAGASGAAAASTAGSLAPQPRRDWFTAVQGRRLEARFSDGRTVGLAVGGVEDARCCDRVEAFEVVLRAEPGVRLPADGGLVLVHPDHGEVPLWAQPKTRDISDGAFVAPFALLR